MTYDRHVMRLLPAIAILFMLWSPVFAQPVPEELAQPQPPTRGRATTGDETPAIDAQIDYLRRAAARLPIAAGLACVLALRPRRKGTPQRQAPVIQTQIILAVVGAVVMLVVGSSLARAFGIVGAAGLVRYRAKINDPKDAGVMLSTLAVGLAAGVGLWLLASFGTVFILAMLWVVESFEPKAHQLFQLRGERGLFFFGHQVHPAEPFAVAFKLQKLGLDLGKWRKLGTLFEAGQRQAGFRHAIELLANGARYFGTALARAFEPRFAPCARLSRRRKALLHFA